MPTSVPDSQKKTHGITWTLYNYEPYVDLIKEYGKTECDYMIFGYEVCPTTGRKHLQGYHHYTNARIYPNKKWRAVADLATNGRDFISNGSAKQNYDYCSKLGDFFECGEMPEQGARTDWRQAINHLQEGGDIYSVVVEQPQLLPAIRSLERFKQMSLKPLNRPVNVIVLIGSPGTGKSRWAYDTYPDLYSKPEGSWYDGYIGQKTLLLDDYYGDIPYAQLLKVCDRYPLQVPIKGGFIHAQWDTVIITSNRSPDTWYHNDMSAFKRRISRIENDYNNAREEDKQAAPCPPGPPPPPPGPPSR